MLKDINALLVDSDSTARNTIKEAFRAIVVRGKCESSRTFADALNKLQTDGPFQFVFIGSTNKKEVLKKFLEEALKLDIKHKPFYILALRPEHQDATYVASFYMHGMHGFICEPYSVDGFFELLNMVKEERGAQRTDEKQVSLTAGFLLGDAMQQLDQLAEQLALGHSGGGYALRDLRRVSESLKLLNEKDSAQFEEVLLRKFENVPAPQNQTVRKKKGKKKEVLHPGALIRAEMEQRGLTLEKLTSLTKIDPAAFKALLSEQGSVTEEIAQDLARIIGKGKSSYLGMQKRFDEFKKEQEKE